MHKKLAVNARSVTEQKKVETEEEVFKMFDNLVEKGAEELC